MASVKVSGLPEATMVGANDIFYVVQSNTSKQIPASIINPSGILQFTVGPLEGNNTVASNGVANIAFFSFNAATYCGVNFLIDMKDTVDTGCRTFGTIPVAIANSVVYTNDAALIYLGDNQIFIFSQATESGSNVSLYMNRQANTTANVLIRWQATYFLS